MPYPSFRQLGGRPFALIRAGFIALLLVTTFATAGVAQQGEKTSAINRLVGVTVASENGATTVDIQTEKPVGYRYTVYDAVDPVRVVVDLPGVNVSAAPVPVKPVHAPVTGVEVSSFNLASGKLGRVELLLKDAADYKVHAAGKDLRIVFGNKKAATQGEEATQGKAVAIPKGKTIKSLNIDRDKVAINGDGSLDNYKYFTLVKPPRLVVDVYGVHPTFRERNFEVPAGFRKIRVGTYRDKTRFVFDARGTQMPDFRLEKSSTGLVLSWQNQANAAQTEVAASVPAKVISAGMAPVTVRALDFHLKDQKSVFTVTLSRPSTVTEPTVADHVLRFGIKNAQIKRRLRRTIDTSAFPSAIRLITPYTVLDDGSQDVRFAVQLKGKTSYDLEKSGDKVVLMVDNGSFGGKLSLPNKKVELSVPATAGRGPTAAAVAPAAAPGTKAKPQTQVSRPAAAVATAAPGNEVFNENTLEGESSAPDIYTGKKISLVFDNADVRKILQLIADVSGLNIVAGDDVKGTVTLHLVDVPWDQALALVTQIKGLGMIKEGNVVRVMPESKIRAMDEAKLTASRTKEKLEDLVTDVVPVSYADVSSVAVPAKKLLTSRGKITEDRRNKQLIVTDIPSVIEKVKHLVKLLDLPERQVLIEARIVEANSNFSRDLGVKWGVNYGTNTPTNPNYGSVGLGGSFLLSPTDVSTNSGTSGLGSGFTFGRLGISNMTLDLKISAMEKSGYGKVISTPRVTTMNGATATISQGTEIPYQSTSGAGSNATVSVSFKKAVLSLTVTPEINPDGSIFLTIDATNDSKGEDVPTGIGAAPAIDTKSATTKVLVKDGQTTVIGGIFVDQQNYSQDGVPWLSKVPILGHLFSSTSKSNQRQELLIFVTPRILQ